MHQIKQAAAYSRTRAWRRKQRLRILNKRKKMLIIPEFSTKKQLLTYINTSKKCSCFMCGNPRKFFNQKSKAEIIAEQKMLDEYLEAS